MCTAAPAAVYCVNDDASLCTSCDDKYHANALSARHERRAIPAESLMLPEQPAVSFVSPQSSDEYGVVPQCGSPAAGPVCARSVSFPPLEFGEDDFFPLREASPSFIDPSEEAGGLRGNYHHYSSSRLTDLDLNLNFDLDAVVPTISEDADHGPGCIDRSLDFMQAPMLATRPHCQQPFYDQLRPLKSADANDFASTNQMPILVPQYVENTSARATDHWMKQKPAGAALVGDGNVVDGQETSSRAAVMQRNKRRRPKRRASYKTEDDDGSFVLDGDLDDAEMDSSDDEFSPSSTSGRRRVGLSSGRRGEVPNVLTTIPQEPEMTREQRIARYRMKRARRNFSKKVRYQSRKAYADIRPRIKGRFVSPEEYAEYMKEKNQEHENVAVVPCC